jgi:prepilin-type N-terminal cleavage/methylation domain-containing protein
MNPLLDQPLMEGDVRKRGKHAVTHVARQLPNGFSLIESAVVTAIITILTTLGMQSYRTLQHLVFDRTALSDVVNAGKALEVLDGTSTFAFTITGPAPIPPLPGQSVSRGTVLYVQRSRVGAGYSWYVRGSHHSGTTTYYFNDSTLSASRGEL